VTAAFVPPPYPYDRLDDLKAQAAERHGEVVDLSIGTPFDPPPPEVVAALRQEFIDDEQHFLDIDASPVFLGEVRVVIGA
jgi:aspartate/methionine/tyrosine aminotransferase